MTRKAARQRREICIAGYAVETREKVFDLDDSVEVWGINMAHSYLYPRRKCDVWFQLHPRDWSSMGQKPTGYWGRPPEHLDFLQKFDGPVYMSYEEPDVPNCTLFDIDAILNKLRVNKARARKYLTSTFAYIMAFAVSEGVDKIYLYGINLTALDEYTHQRPCMEYWIGQAEARGIEVEIPAASALCKGPLYGGFKSTDDPHGDLLNMAFDRLQNHKTTYMERAFDLNTAHTGKMEVAHWAEFLSQVGSAVVEKFESDSVVQELFSAEARQYLSDTSDMLRNTLQERITKRIRNYDNIINRSHQELLRETGYVADSQHWLATLGGIDHRAPALPDVRFPSQTLKNDIEVPSEGQAI